MKPILFNTEMVRAILDDRKTVTRRIIKPQPCEGHGPVKFMRWFQQDWYTTFARCGDDVSVALCDRKPPYQPGGILWVRETWARLPVTPGDHFRPRGVYYYKAGEDLRPERFRGNGWRPSIHMPMEAARLFLRVTGVTVERLQDITPEQIDAEGCKEYGYGVKTGERMPSIPTFFKIAWDSTIKPSDLPLYGWEANPWVWVIEFERVGKEAAQREEREQ